MVQAQEDSRLNLLPDVSLQLVHVPTHVHLAPLLWHTLSSKGVIFLHSSPLTHYEPCAYRALFHFINFHSGMCHWLTVSQYIAQTGSLRLLFSFLPLSVTIHALSRQLIFIEMCPRSSESQYVSVARDEKRTDKGNAPHDTYTGNQLVSDRNTY